MAVVTFGVSGTHVLITGAASGMGRLYALRAAEEGAAIVELWDIAPVGLAATAEQVRSLGARPVTRVADLRQQRSIADAAGTTLDTIGAPDVLVNNAGIVRGAEFWAHDAADIAAILAVNTLAPMYLTRTLLPAMMADPARPRRILNVASAAGTLANPRMSVYAASKWALIGWSDSLRLELARCGFGHIAVTTFCPSYVATGMFAGARGPLFTPVLTPEVAVDRAWRAMLSGRAVRYTPWTVKLAAALRGGLPARAWDAVADLFGVYDSMTRFTGRPADPAPATGPHVGARGRRRTLGG